MSKMRLEWKVGLFMFIGLTLLALLLIAFSKGMTLFHSTYDLRLHAANVSGLKVRAAVLMAGVQIGTVSDIKLAPEGKSVTITLRVFSQYLIHKDARCIIEQSGFLGDQYVAILPTSNLDGVFQNGDSADAEVPFNILEAARSANGFLQRMDETAKKLNDAISDVRKYVLNENTLTNLSTMVGNFHEVSAHALTTVDTIGALIQSNTPALSVSISNIGAFSEQMKQTAAALSDVVATNRDDIALAVKNIENSTEVLKTLLDDVQAGKGTAGSLLKNEQLATNLDQIARNLSITTSNLNTLGLWGILWRHKPPKTTTPPPTHPLTAPKYSQEQPP